MARISAAWVAFHFRSVATVAPSSSMTRARSVFVRATMRPSRPFPLAFVNGMTDWRIAAVPPGRSTSLHRNPSASPRRHPVRARKAKAGA